MSKTLKLIAIAAVTFTLAACGSNNTEASTSGDSTSSTHGAHNDADVSFAQSMIPHHAQAVVMAKMAKRQANDPRVKALASDIQAAQQPEISTMSDWLKTWGEKVPPTSTSMGDMGSTDTSTMTGMMTGGQMTQLGKASGTTFDRMWLDMMIQHHEGAIKMAKSEQTDGENVDAIALAEKIEAAQTAEITRMKAMLGS